MTITLDTAAGDDLARTINTGVRASFDTREHLENAARQARERNYQDLLIVDADAHHYELASWSTIVKYIEDPILRHRAQAGPRPPRPVVHLDVLRPWQPANGRPHRPPNRGPTEQTENDVPRDLTLMRREMEGIGIDYQIVFPTPMLELGMHPDPEVEVAICWAYTRWLTEEILPHDAEAQDDGLPAVQRSRGQPADRRILCRQARRRRLHGHQRPLQAGPPQRLRRSTAPSRSAACRSASTRSSTPRSGSSRA